MGNATKLTGHYEKKRGFESSFTGAKIPSSLGQGYYINFLKNAGHL